MRKKFNYIPGLFLVVCISIATTNCIGQRLDFRSSTGLNFSKFVGSNFLPGSNSYFMSPFINFTVNKRVNKYISLGLGLEYSLKGNNYNYNFLLDSGEFSNSFGKTRIHYLILPFGTDINYKKFFFHITYILG